MTTPPPPTVQPGPGSPLAGALCALALLALGIGIVERGYWAIGVAVVLLGLAGVITAVSGARRPRPDEPADPGAPGQRPGEAAGGWTYHVWTDQRADEFAGPVRGVRGRVDLRNGALFDPQTGARLAAAGGGGVVSRRAGTAPRGRVCPRPGCGHVNRLVARFCARCGVKLPASPGAPGRRDWPSSGELCRRGADCLRIRSG